MACFFALMGSDFDCDAIVIFGIVCRYGIMSIVGEMCGVVSVLGLTMPCKVEIFMEY